MQEPKNPNPQNPTQIRPPEPNLFLQTGAFFNLGKKKKSKTLFPPRCFEAETDK